MERGEVVGLDLGQHKLGAPASQRAQTPLDERATQALPAGRTELIKESWLVGKDPVGQLRRFNTSELEMVSELPANTPVPLTVPLTVSGAWRVSAIQISASGTLYAKPMNIR